MNEERAEGKFSAAAPFLALPHRLRKLQVASTYAWAVSATVVTVVLAVILFLKKRTVS